MLVVNLSGIDLADDQINTATKLVELLNATKPEWLPNGSINVRFVDDSTIRELNNKYSGKDQATDVLSFSYIEGEMPQIDDEIGDIAISLDTAKKQAKEAGNSLADEVALLLLHGIMHLAGLDHEDAAEKVQMDQLQSEILTAAGIKYRDFKWA